MTDGEFDVGQVCMNGHPINGSVTSMPQFNQDYCDKCGEKTLTTCPNCNIPIRGQFRYPTLSEYKPPAFCYKCGKSFIWTERKIQAAIELAVEEGKLDEEESKQLEESVHAIVRDTPRTQLGASRFKKIMTKIGVSTAGAVHDIIVDVVSETAKKIIWPEN